MSFQKLKISHSVALEIDMVLEFLCEQKKLRISHNFGRKRNNRCEEFTSHDYRMTTDRIMECWLKTNGGGEERREEKRREENRDYKD